jgi:hypothetical protein
MKRISNLIFAVVLGLLCVSSAIAEQTVHAGNTSKIATLIIRDTSSPTTGAGKTGLAFNTAGFGCSYKNSAGSSTALTLVTTSVNTWASADSTHAGFVEVDATNKPGEYQLSIPNATIASGDYVTFTCKGSTNVAQTEVRILIDPPATLATALAKSIPETAFAPTNTFASGSSTSVLHLNGSETSNDITGQQICAADGVAAKTCRPISAYDPATKFATVTPVFTNAPASGDGYTIGGYIAVSGGGGSCPAASTIADSVWNAARNTHTLSGSFGEGIPQVMGNILGGISGNLAGTAAQCLLVAAAGINAASFAADTPFATAQAQSYSAPTIRLVSSATYANNSLNNMNSVYIASAGVGVGQIACIKSYNSSTKDATLVKPFAVPPSGTIKYMVLPTPNCNLALYPSGH